MFFVLKSSIKVRNLLQSLVKKRVVKFAPKRWSSVLSFAQCFGVYLRNFFCKILAFLHFFSFLTQKMLKIKISTCVWIVQHPNDGQMGQELLDYKRTAILCFFNIPYDVCVDATYLFMTNRQSQWFVLRQNMKMAKFITYLSKKKFNFMV